MISTLRSGRDTHLGGFPVQRIQRARSGLRGNGTLLPRRNADADSCTNTDASERVDLLL